MFEGEWVTQQKPQSFTDSRSRDTEGDGIKNLSLTGETDDGKDKNRLMDSEHELQHAYRKLVSYFAKNDCVGTV